MDVVRRRPRTRVECPARGRDYLLRDDGLIRSHASLWDNGRCIGSEKTPGEARDAVIDRLGDAETDRHRLANLVSTTVSAGGWMPSDTAPQGELVEATIIDEVGHRPVERLRRSGRLWFVPDGTTYVYWSPSHWRPVEERRGACTST